ncbi:sortase [Rubrobacter radiotolerans]|uniref:Sortase n=1 Tax=Rubrobacter radiotolerans TaxID=42256 RepID=A0A023X0S2_RUBRA|nr:class E sortase [Rubrobacter radiotolerans]AHY45585.1 sortase [Rubrobacter radiotolerans]MDX5892999.1 class E sortase [Rubrobacter radiotolerans]SMC02877.1 sortase A [Rubrobacter radiotolerans DSM 5868]
MKVYRSSRFGLREPRSPGGAREPERSSFPPATSRRERRRAEKKEKRQRRGRRPLAALLSFVMVLAGVGVLAYAVLGGGTLTGIVNSVVNPVEPPSSTEMTLTVPEMSRVKDAPVFTASAADTAALDAGAVHVEGTGFPWEQEANVYIAGHRLGYAGTGSFLQFYDLTKLENGDEIILTDSNGTRYTYTVFNEMRVSPTDAHVLDPTPGKNIVSLQTCSLPDYSQRIIVQGELTSVA